MRCWLWPSFIDYPEAFYRDVEISHNAKMGIQPLQFGPYSRPCGIGNHRREEQYGGAQVRQRNAHPV